MTLTEFIRMLAALALEHDLGEAVVLVSQDPEGNGFHTLEAEDLASWPHRVVADRPWVTQKFPDLNGKPAIVLWPSTPVDIT